MRTYGVQLAVRPPSVHWLHAAQLVVVAVVPHEPVPLQVKLLAVSPLHEPLQAVPAVLHWPLVPLHAQVPAQSPEPHDVPKPVDPEGVTHVPLQQN